jgi:hypothetical protein
MIGPSQISPPPLAGGMTIEGTPTGGPSLQSFSPSGEALNSAEVNTSTSHHQTGLCYGDFDPKINNFVVDPEARRFKSAYPDEVPDPRESSLAQAELAWIKLKEYTDGTMSWADLMDEEDQATLALSKLRDEFIVSTRTLFRSAEEGKVTSVLLPETLRHFPALETQVLKIASILNLKVLYEVDASFVRPSVCADLFSADLLTARERYAALKSNKDTIALVAQFVGIRSYMSVLLTGIPVYKKLLENPNLGFQAALCFLYSQVNTQETYKRCDLVLKHLSGGRTAMIEAFASFFGKGNDCKAAKLMVAAFESCLAKLASQVRRGDLRRLMEILLPILGKKSIDMAVGEYPTTSVKKRVLVSAATEVRGKKVPAKYENQFVRHKQVPQVRDLDLTPIEISAKLKLMNQAINKGLTNALRHTDEEEISPFEKLGKVKELVKRATHSAFLGNEKITRLRHRIRSLAALTPDGMTVIKGEGGRDRKIIDPKKYDDCKTAASNETNWVAFGDLIDKKVIEIEGPQFWYVQSAPRAEVPVEDCLVEDRSSEDGDV